MSDVEADREVDGPIEEDDNAHQTCYVFTPLATGDQGRETPTRKRRKTKHSSAEESPIFPLLNHGAEPATFSQVRHDTLKRVWEQRQERIDTLLAEVNAAALTEVEEFVSSSNPRGSQKLQAGIIISGPDGGAQTRFLEQWKCRQEGGKSGVVIQLRASHCVNLQTTLKNIIRNIISSQIGPDGYQKFLSKHKRLIPMSFDLELLRIFVQEEGSEQVVLCILDVETFDIGILSELLYLLNESSESIPMVVLIGVATTVELLESRLPKSTIDLLEATTFTLRSSDHVLQKILDNVKLDSRQDVKFGPLTISALEELMQNQGLTIAMFIHAIKYAIMSHFFANSLSVLLSTDTSSLYADKSLCEAIRNTPSFQTYCESLVSSDKAASAKEAAQLLHDDEAVFQAALTAVQDPSNSSFTLPEATTINTRTVLNAFTPRPRHVLERALSKPSDYLSCDCCTNATGSGNGTPPPTSTLYTLLQEAGTLINVRDLYDAFASRHFTTSDSSAAAATANDQDRAAQMSTFYTALAELRMLGLVKGSSSAGVKKRVLAGTAATATTDGSALGVSTAAGAATGRNKDRYGDVDFVAKTGWMGL